jgi:hypothetical protein
MKRGSVIFVIDMTSAPLEVLGSDIKPCSSEDLGKIVIDMTSVPLEVLGSDIKPGSSEDLGKIVIHMTSVPLEGLGSGIYLQDARPYACHLCEYSCKLKCNLGKHIKNVHKLDSTTSKSVTSVNTSDTHQEVELGTSDFPERRNDDYDLLLSISRHDDRHMDGHPVNR